MKPVSLTQSETDAIARDITDDLIGNFFSAGKTHINGNELLTFANHDQINKFILLQIYQDWRAYLQTFSHPYYNFSNEEVHKALNHFLQVLSIHIRISNADFRVLVERAVFSNLSLTIAPLETLIGFFFGQKERISIELFDRYAKYFSDFGFVIRSISVYHHNNDLDIVEKSLFIQKFEKAIEIFEKKELNTIDKYRSTLFSLLSGKQLFDLEQTFEPAKAYSPESTIPAYEPEIPKIYQPEPEPEDEIPGIESYTSEIIEPLPSLNLIVDDSVLNLESDDFPSSVSPIAEINSISSEPVGDGNVSASQLENESTKENSRVVDLFQDEKESLTVGEQLSRNAQGEILLEKIPVHKQFQFVQIVFGGNTVKFKALIDKLNKTQDWEEAQKLLEHHVFEQEGYNGTDPVSQEFVALIKSRYGL